MTSCGNASYAAFEQRVVELLEEDKEVSIQALGGQERLLNLAGEIAEAPFSAEVLWAVFKCPTVDVKVFRTFVLDCIANSYDEFVMQNIVSLVDAAELPNKLEDACYKSYLSVVEDDSKAYPFRIAALDGAFRLALRVPKRRHLFISTLLEFDSDYPPYLLRAAARIIGVAYAHWPSDDLVDQLNELGAVEGVEGEAAHALGLVRIHQGLVAQNYGSVKEHFNGALEAFSQAMSVSELRVDAEILKVALEALLICSKPNVDPVLFLDKINKLRKLLGVYFAWVEQEGLPDWLGSQVEVMLQWNWLVVTLQNLTESLDEPSWLDASLVIEQQLLAAYTAGRKILRKNQSGGIEELLSPMIETSLIKKEGQLHHLRKWIQSGVCSELVEDAKQLVYKVDRFVEEGRRNPSVAASAEHAGVACLEKLKCSSAVKECYLTSLKDDLAQTSPLFIETLEACLNDLTQFVDFKNSEIRERFQAVLLATLRFLAQRLDHTKGDTNQLAYLFKIEEPLPVENDLQQDYFQWIKSNQGQAFQEVKNVGAGRTDVIFISKGINIVTEVKRELEDSSFEALERSYIQQATEYQNTNVRLGILLVLDLVERGKGFGVGHISSLVKVVRVEREGEEFPRGVVIVKVPGLRRTPSELSKESKKKN